MATHSSILAWRLPWKEEPGGLQRGPWGHKELDTAEQLNRTELILKILYQYVQIYLYLYQYIQINYQ